MNIVNTSQILNNANLNNLFYSDLIDPKTGLVLFGSEYEVTTPVHPAATEISDVGRLIIPNKRYAYLCFFNLMEYRIEYFMLNVEGIPSNLFKDITPEAHPALSPARIKYISDNLVSGRINADMIRAFKYFYYHVTQCHGVVSPNPTYKEFSDILTDNFFINPVRKHFDSDLEITCDTKADLFQTFLRIEREPSHDMILTREELKNIPVLNAIDKAFSEALHSYVKALYLQDPHDALKEVGYLASDVVKKFKNFNLKLEFVIKDNLNC